MFRLRVFTQTYHSATAIKHSDSAVAEWYSTVRYRVYKKYWFLKKKICSPAGFEPTTSWMQVSCSTHWAIWLWFLMECCSSFLHFFVFNLLQNAFCTNAYHRMHWYRLWGKQYSFSVHDVLTIQQQCGANRILSVSFCVSNVHTIQQQCGEKPYSFIQQQCGANCILSVNSCSRHTYHSATVWGKPYSFSKLLCWRRTYHSATMWDKLYSWVIEVTDFLSKISP